jgi:AcrR family transcriptional regulator
MSQLQKPKRTYNSSRRQAQARETRQQIVLAARKLFIERGYAGATIEAIAQEAGVAPETVFAIFGNKRGVLASLMSNLVGGDDQPIPLLERPGPQTVLQEKDPIHQIHLFARDISNILERVASVFEIVRIAAKTEPEIADLFKQILERRFNNLSEFILRVSNNQPLREGLNFNQATEIVWALTSPEIFNLFLKERGWSKEKYITWLGDSLIRLLLP